MSGGAHQSPSTELRTAIFNPAGGHVGLGANRPGVEPGRDVPTSSGQRGHEPNPRQGRDDLHLMVVDMLTKALAAWNHDRVMAGAQSPDERGDAGMRDDERRLAEDASTSSGRSHWWNAHVGPGTQRDRCGRAGRRARRHRRASTLHRWHAGRDRDGCRGSRRSIDGPHVPGAVIPRHQLRPLHEELVRHGLDQTPGERRLETRDKHST